MSSRPQWGQGERKNAESVEKVFAEMARFYSGVRIAVGGGDNARAGVTGLLLADPFKGSLLQHPQSLVLAA